MVPLSYELAGLVLLHAHFGTHLDDNGRTGNEDLEMESYLQMYRAHCQ